MRIEVLGFDNLKQLYETGPNFAKPWTTCKNHMTNEQDNWTDYFIPEDILFKGTQLYIPKGSMRDNIMKGET